MKTKINFNQFIPHIIAVFVFLLITIIFFHPVFFENKAIFQHDILQGQGAAQSLKQYREATGEEGLWAGSIFSGMPANLVSLIYSGDLVIHFQKAYSLWLPHPTGLLLMSFFSMYILLFLAFKVRPYLSLAGAIAFGLTSFQIISLGAGHNAKVGAVALMPLIFAGIVLAFRGKLGLGFILTAFGLAMQIRINHLQITYYLLIICIAYGINEVIVRLKAGTLASLLKPLSVLILAAVLAVGANLGKLWGIFEYSQYSIRGKSELNSGAVPAGESGLNKEYAFEFSNEIFEPLVLFIPNFYGGASNQNLGTSSNLADALRRQGVSPAQLEEQTKNIPTYWGDQRLSAPYYAGAITVFLFVLGLLILEGKQKWWLLSLVVFGIMLSWGKNFAAFNYFLFDYMPGYNKFRSVTFAIIIPIFCMPILGFQGLEKLLGQGLNKRNQKILFMAAIATAGFALIAALLAGVGSYVGGIDYRLSSLGYPGWFMQAIKEDREALLRSDGFRSMIFILLATGLIWFIVKKLLNEQVALFGFTILFLLDMFLVDRRYFDKENFSRSPERTFFTETEADKLIKTDKDNHFRVLYLLGPFTDARTSYHHRSIGGYHGAKMRRYQDVVENCLQDEIQEIIIKLRNRDQNFNSLGVINMLDTRYFLAGSARGEVIGNEAANGPAWFVQQVKKVLTPDEEIRDLPNANTKTIAIVNTSRFEVHDEEGYFTSGTIDLVQNRPNHLVYDVDTAGDAFAVFSEIYYPIGWTATIDGQEAEIIQANYILRALEIPEGKHTVEFRFEPDSYVIGNKVMWTANILLIIALAGVCFLEIKKLKTIQIPGMLE